MNTSTETVDSNQPALSGGSIRLETQGPVGFLVLAQPATLNALSLDMVNALHAGLQDLESNDEIKLIIIQSDLEKAFCAGGDMKHIRQHAMQADFEATDQYFKNEYALNLAIAQCSKPYLALIDGVAMGGGLGLSVNGRFRVVTEHAVMAMPESRIGFFPDVGASWFLPRLPHRCGYWLGLTSMSVKGEQCVQIGLATHLIPRAQLAALMQSLQDALQGPAVTMATAEQAVKTCLDSMADSNSTSASLEEQGSVQGSADDFEQVMKQRAHWFADVDLDSIRTRLQADADSSPDAEQLLALLDSASPFSLATTLKLFERAQGLELAQCLALERATALTACMHPDLIEGVRAVLVDKDKQPRWDEPRSVEPL